MVNERQEQTTPGAEYQDPPARTSRRGLLTRSSLWIERVTENWANQPRRQTAPLTPTRREVLIGSAVSTVLAVAAYLRLTNQKPADVVSYVGSKTGGVLPSLGSKGAPYSISVGPEQQRPDYLNPSPTPEVTDYSGSKSYVTFTPEKPRLGKSDNTFVNNDSTNVSFEIDFGRLNDLLNHDKLPEQVTPNFILYLLVTDQSLATDEETKNYFSKLLSMRAYQTYQSTYLASKGIVPSDHHTIELGISTSTNIEPTLAKLDVHHISGQQILDQLTYDFSLSILRRVQQAVAYENRSPLNTPTMDEIEQLMGAEVRQSPPAKITYINSDLLKPDSQATTSGGK